MRFSLLALSLLFPVLARAETLPTVRDFGAIGDGQADDTAAVERAVAKGSVYFPKGVYRLTHTVTIDLLQTGFAALSSDGTARIVMAGAGPAFHFVGNHAGTADPPLVKPDVWEHQRAPLVERLEIVGANPEADGIEATGIMQLIVRGTSLRELRHGIHLTVRNRNVIISDCHIYHNRGCGVFFDQVNLHQTNIIGCHISYNGGGGVVTRGGEIRNLQIGTCDIESNMEPDGSPGANVLIDCTGGSTAEVAIVGCTLQHNSKSAGSANIRYLGAGIVSTTNPAPTQEGELTITGNVFSDVMTNIHLDHVRGATIAANTFWEGFEHDLLIEESDAVVIGPNSFDRNPRYIVNRRSGQEHNGIVLRKCTAAKLTGLILKGEWNETSALLLDQCSRSTVQDCSIFDSDGVGLWLKDDRDCLISGCVIRDDRAEKKATLSLKREGGQGNRIRGNWLVNGAEGIEAQDEKENFR